MIRQITRLARSGTLAIAVAAGLGALGSSEASAQDRYERRDGFRCPTVGDCGRTGFRDRYDDRPSFRSRDNDHRDWQRNHRRAYNERRSYDRGPNVYLDLEVPLYQYEEPVYVAPRAIYRGGLGAHSEWCFNRYRSYRIYDNSFQPYRGPRQRCYSPYS